MCTVKVGVASYVKGVVIGRDGVGVVGVVVGCTKYSDMYWTLASKNLYLVCNISVV